MTTVVAGTNQKSIPRACGLLASIVVLAACSGSSGQLNETEPTRFPEGAVETSVSQNRDDPTDIRSPATIREDPVAATLREQSQAISACAAEEGVSVEVASDGEGVVWRAPAGQEARYSEVVDGCARIVAERFGVAQGEPTAEDLELWYRAFLWTRGCMIDEGYPVSDPPTLDSYIDSGGSNWHPYNAVFNASGGDIRPGVPFSDESFRELESMCPQDLTYLISELDLDETGS